MLSTLTIVSIFTEIFAAGFLLIGFISLLKNFFSLKKLKDLSFALLFLMLFVYVALTLASQIMFNFGRDLSELILIHKSISVSLVLASFFLWTFIVEKFRTHRLRWLYLVLLVLVVGFIYRIFDSSVNLVYRQEIIEPIVDYSLYVPVKPFFALAWVVLLCVAFASCFLSRAGKRTLTCYLGGSALLFVFSMLCHFFYVRSGEVGYLLSSWILILFSTLGFVLAELIPPDAPEAKRPLDFLRRRILFKLMLIFVLLIVLLFGTTTVATINVSKNVFFKAVVSSYQREVQVVASKINQFNSQPSQAELQKIISNLKLEGNATVFVVNSQGQLLAHPDEKRALSKEEITKNQAVQKVLQKKSGAGEFENELSATMVGAFQPVEKFSWGVVVQEPIESAYFELRKLETSSLIFVIAGIVLTSLTGMFFARSIEKPIKELTRGTEEIAGGNLKCRVGVETNDEIGSLACAFNQMTKELQESQERLILSEKLASLGTMAAGMAHEIRNPLVSLRTFTQLLLQKWDDPEFRKKFSSIIPQEIERINKIAESLLKFGRPMKQEYAEVDVNALIEEVLLLFESETKKYNIRVTKKLAKLPKILGDAGQFQQAFVNFVKNAIEAMHENGGQLVVKTDTGEVVHLGRQEGEQSLEKEGIVWGKTTDLGKPVPVVFIEFSDTGQGIDETNLKSLFDPFFTTKITGTGMGLPITLKIIEDHGGSIKVKSKKGKGTTFLLTLPQQEA